MTVPLSIRDNPGLMGSKLIVTYDSAVLQPQAVTRGTVTQSGMMQDSIGAGEAGTLLIVWSDTDAVKADGTLAVLTFKAQQQKETTLTVSYSQPDTFDGSFADVKLDCKPVEIVFDGETQTSPPVAKTPDSRDIQAAVESVEDKADVSAVNEAIARLTGTEDYYATPEEMQSAYNAAIADNFVETALLAVDGAEIAVVIQNALREVGAETVDTIPPEKQDAFVKSIETALRDTEPDVPTLSDTLSTDEAVCAIQMLQSKNEEKTESLIELQDKDTRMPIKRILICIFGLFGLVSVICFACAKTLKHKRDNKETSKNENI